MKLSKKMILIFIFFLFIPFSYAQNLDCSDSDGGIDYYHQGCISFYNLEICDMCIDSKTLIETYCDDKGDAILTKYDCPGECVNDPGMCVDLTATTTTTTTTTTTEAYMGTTSTTTTTTSTTTTTTGAYMGTTSTTKTTTTSTTISPTEEEIEPTPTPTENEPVFPEGTPISCTGSAIHDCSGRKDTEGYPDIVSIDYFYVPSDHANCGDTLSVGVAWYGAHGYGDICDSNYWAFFLKSSSGDYTFFGSCQSFQDDCSSEYVPYGMTYDLKMPNKGTIHDGAYTLVVTGKTEKGYCNPNENGVDAKYESETSINLGNCEISGLTTTTRQGTTTTMLNQSSTTTTISGPYMPDTTTTTVGGDAGSQGGCPILKVFNGKELVIVEKLNIHALKYQDTIATSTFTMQPVNGRYEIILDEAAYLFWDGSHINSVKLTDGTGNECKLISATHSKQGDVLSAIAKSDDVRVRSYPGERIKLTYDGCSGNQFTFSIEGYNRKCGPEGCELSTTNIIPIVVIITLVIIGLIIGIMKFTNNKSVEPKPYNEKSNEQPFY